MEKKTYEELENEVVRLKRTCAAYKAENTKLRTRFSDLSLRYVALSNEYGLAKNAKNEYCEELAKLRSRSWWERFKDLFWFD